MSIEKTRHSQRDINEFKREEKPLGKGQFGCVYPCTDMKNGKKYAIKLIEPSKDVSTEDYAYKLFIRDVTIQSQIRHRALLPFYCWGENCKIDEYGEISFIMSPLMKNGSLDMFISDNRYKELDPTKKMIIIYGSAVGMRHLHKRGIFHRNLKPENILIDELYYPYIGVFGFSNYIDTTFSIKQVIPLYIDPELSEYDESLLSNANDIYAFGQIIFSILTGKKFCDIKNTFKLQEYLMKGKRPTIPEDVNDFYRQLITRCWSQSPDDRPTFEEIVNLIEKPENLLPGTDRNKFEKYKEYVNDDDDDFDEEEEEEDINEPLKTFKLSFRGYPQISLNKSNDFAKFMLFYFNFNYKKKININLENNITVGDAKIVIAIEPIIPPSYLKITFNGKELNEKGKLSLIKCSKKNPIHINVIKDVSHLPSEKMEREVEVENEVYELVDFNTTKSILRSGLMDSLAVFHNFFVCGKNISLFNSCIEAYEKI